MPSVGHHVVLKCVSRDQQCRDFETCVLKRSVLETLLLVIFEFVRFFRLISLDKKNRIATVKMSRWFQIDNDPMNAYNDVSTSVVLMEEESKRVKTDAADCIPNHYCLIDIKETIDRSSNVVIHRKEANRLHASIARKRKKDTLLKLQDLNVELKQERARLQCLAELHGISFTRYTDQTSFPSEVGV